MNTHRFLSILRTAQACLVIGIGALSTAKANTVAYWNFNSLTTGTNNGTSYTPTSGSGSLTLSGWTTTATSGITAFAGSTINALNSDPAGQSLALQGGKASGTGSTVTNNGASLVLSFSLTGLQSPVVSFATQKTATGFTSNQVAYSTDGTNYTNFGSAYNPATAFALQTIDLSSVTALNGVSTVYVKITFNGATNGSGNNRIDNLLITASPGVTTYSVTYDGNGNTGGSAPTDSTAYTAGATVTVANPGSLAKTGYTFSGWNTAVDGSGTTYTAGSGTFTINANTTLYAKWTPKATYTLTYDGNGNTGGAAPVDGNSPYYSGSTVTVLDNTSSLTKTGYAFSGWNTAVDGSGTTYTAGGTFSIIGNTTLYAQWTPTATYTVTYNGNNNTGGAAPVDGNSPYSPGSTVTVLDNTGSLTRTGYSFSGWNAAADGSGTPYTAGGTFTINGNITLYAQWTNLPTNPTATASASATSVPVGQNVTLTVTVTPGAYPTSSGLTVTGDLSAIGGSSTQTFSSGAGSTFTYAATIPANLAGGSKLLNFSVSDNQSRTATASLTLNIYGNLTIYHTNDTHARVTPHKWIVPQHTFSTATNFEDVGGISYMGSKVLSLTAATPDALVLDGGDISEGNPIGDWNGPGNTPGSFGDGTIVDYFKMLDTKLKAIPGRTRGLDAMVVGNHDIRDISYLQNMKAASSQFPILSMNICNHGTHTPYYNAYTIVNVNGNKIGIVGYTTESADSPETAVNSLIDVVKCDWSSTDSTKIHFADIVNDLRNNQGCNLVILLTHMGHSGLCTVTSANPTPILVDNAVAKLPEVAVTGHWHTYCDTVWQPSALNYKTIFTEAGSFQHYVGELKINGAGKYISSNYYPLRNSDITPDSDIATYLQTRKDQYAATNPTYGVDQVLGYTQDNLLLDNYMKWWSADEYPWSGNNTAGNWICDAVQWKAAALFSEQVDLSLEAGGGVRSDIVAGPVKYTNIYETFPWPDDTIYVVNMTGQQIWNYIRDHTCDAALSTGWHVTAYDGVPTEITLNGSPINLAQTYKVAINNYMYLHDASNFATIDPAPQTSTYLARTALMDYTATFDQSHPYQAGPSRYTLNTEFSGGYRVVVTMMNDSDSRTSFDDGFVRFLSATPETLAHRGTQQVPTDLVNEDGSINRANRLSENEWYRSYLGFKTGALHQGDIVEVWGKGGFYGGDPEFIDQEGVQSDGVEFKIVGHDASLAQPTYFSSINGFWNQTYKNHYVKFFAKKSGTSTVTDNSGTTITIQDVTGYATKTLPGNIGQILMITGVPTSESYALRFRADSAAVATPQNYPPDSQINPVATNQTSSPLTLTATATAAPGSNQNYYSIEPVADAQIESGAPGSNFGTSTNLYIQSAATGSYGNERAWLRFDLSSLPAGSTITSATLNMSCWKASGASLPAEVRGGNDDTWGETAINWNNQPTFGSVLDTQTLASGVTNLYYTWDATSFVQSKYAGNKLVSLLVKPVTENSTDTTSPSYGFDSKEYTSNHPYLKVTTPSASAQVTVTQVQFFYRYSADNTTWTAWSPFQTVSASPWNASFNYPNGDGQYEFYSVATDSNGTVEPAPPYADTAVTYKSGTAVIAVNQNGPLSNNATVNYGNVEANKNQPLTFTINNTGNQTLTGLSATIDPAGPNAADFSISTAPSTSVSPGGSSNMVITFAPLATGPRGAAIHIASSDTANNPFNILVNGNGLSHFDAWRLANYGSTNNSGNGADLATPQNDGIPNLIKFATGMPPVPSATNPVSFGKTDSTITFSYSRSKVAVADGIVYAIEWSDALADGIWSSDGVVAQAPVDQGDTERVTSTIPTSQSGHRFVHLRVTRP